jgi:hypothetical protein
MGAGRLGAAVAALLLAASPAAAQMVRGQDPQSVVEAMRAAGFTADLGVDKVGDPKIDSSISDTKFVTFFYNCTTIQCHSGHAMRGKVTLEQINEWNRSQRFGRAFIDKEGDPVLEMDVDLDDGGLSRELFVDNLEFWHTVVGKFEKHIGYRK